MNSPRETATIYALATPVPSRAHPGAISVIRLSGPRATDALIFLTERRAFERGRSAREPAPAASPRLGGVVRGAQHRNRRDHGRAASAWRARRGRRRPRGDPPAGLLPAGRTR